MRALRNSRPDTRWSGRIRSVLIRTGLIGGAALLLMAAGWASSWESIHTAARDIRTVQADFTQEKHLQILAQPLVSRGRLIFAAPDRLRWEYEAPPAQRSFDGPGPGAAFRQDRSDLGPKMLRRRFRPCPS